MGATIQEAVDDLCSARRSTSLAVAILKAHSSAVEATSLELEAAKFAVITTEKKLADQKAALWLLQSDLSEQQK